MSYLRLSGHTYWLVYSIDSVFAGSNVIICRLSFHTTFAILSHDYGQLGLQFQAKILLPSSYLRMALRIIVICLCIFSDDYIF